jgi:hypothetical protein
MQINQQLNRQKIFCRATVRQRIIVGLVFLGIILLFGLLWMMAHYNFTLWPYPCGFKQRHGLPCPGCGMTTAAVTFAVGKFFKAFYIQPAGALFCSIAAIGAFLALFTAVFGVYFRILKRFFTEIKVKYVIIGVIIIIAGGWMVTLARALAAKG